MTHKQVMVTNLCQIAEGKFERSKGEFIEFSRKDMMEMASYALNPTKTDIEGGSSLEDTEYIKGAMKWCDESDNGKRFIKTDEFVLIIRTLIGKLKKALI